MYVFNTEGFLEVVIESWPERELLQFHLFVQCLHFILTIAFVSRHICFK